MPSLVTFNGLFYNMSLVIYPFWIAFPVVKSFNTTDLQEAKKLLLKTFIGELLFLYTLLLLITQRCVVYRIEIHFHSLTCLNSTDIFQLFLGFMSFNKQFF